MPTKKTVVNVAPAATRTRSVKNAITPIAKAKPKTKIKINLDCNPTLESSSISRRRISGPQLEIPTRYRTWPSLGKAIRLREDFANGMAYGAKNFWAMHLKHDGNHYIAVFHDGQPFDTEEMIGEALNPGTSTGATGANGCGGMTAPLLSVKSQSEYQHHILSKSTDGEVWLWRSVLDDGTIIAGPAPGEFKNGLIKTLGPLWDSINVGYISRYTPKLNDEAFISPQVRMLVKDFMPSTANDDTTINFCYGSGLTVGEDVYNASTGRGTNLANLTDTETFDREFARSSFEFYAPKCEVGRNDNVVNFDAVVEITLYDGLAHNPINWVLVRTNGDSAGKSMWDCKSPDFNTFLTLAYPMGERFDRLNNAPSFVGHTLDKVAVNFGVNIGDRTSRSSDFSNQSHLSKIIKGNEASYSRVPYARVNVRITAINSLNGRAPRGSNDDDLLRNAFGSIDELFCSVDRQTVLNCISEIYRVASEYEPNEEAIAEFRALSETMWPQSKSDLASLKPIESFRGVRMALVDPNNHASKVLLAPGQFRQGELIHADTGEYADESYSFEGVGTASYKLTHLGGNTWSVFVPPLQICDEDGNLLTVDAKTWVAHENQKDLYPKPTVRLMKDGESYQLINPVDLPELPKPTVICGGGGGGGSGGGGSNPKVGKEDGNRSMFKAVNGPREQRVLIIGNTPYLNSGNEEIKKLFKDILQTKSLRDTLWEEIVTSAPKYHHILKNAINVVPGRTELGRKIQKEWNDDVDAYMLNKLLEPIFLGDTARKLKAKNEMIGG